MTMVHGYHDWGRPILRTPDKHAGRGPILIAVMLGCMAFWALTGFAISWLG